MSPPGPADPEQLPSTSTSFSVPDSDDGREAETEGGIGEGEGEGGDITPTKPPIKLPEIASISLVEPTNQKKKHRPAKAFRILHAMICSFPIMIPTACRFSLISGSKLVSLESHKSWSTGVNGGAGTRVTGTLFGYKKGKVSLSLQETPNCLPSLVIELGITMNALHKELEFGMVRIALECEKKPHNKIELMDEEVWTMYCNGKRSEYGFKRDASEEDLSVMELLKAVSQGGGVLPLESTAVVSGDGLSSSSSSKDCELVYIRADFEHVVGSKDSETLYMLSPEGIVGPELTIFFVRI